MSCAELDRLTPLELYRIYRDYLRSSSMARPLHRVNSDATDTHNDDGLPRLYLGVIHSTPPPSADSAACQARCIKSNVVRDDDSRICVNNYGLRERTQTAELSDRGVGSREPQPKISGVVPPRSSEQVSAEVTQIRLASATPTAEATGRKEAENDAVSFFDAFSVSTRFGDDACAFMAQCERISPDRQITLHDMIVRMAQPRGDHLNLDLIFLAVLEL
jgi:hypothetical protein